MTKRFAINSYLALFALVLSILAVCIGMRDAGAQTIISGGISYNSGGTVIVQQGAGVYVAPQGNVIIHRPSGRATHVYTDGVTYVQGQGGNNVIIHGGNYGPSTCYVGCFHQGYQTRRHVIRQRPRTSFSFGITVVD